jgi:hypothetical protein
MTLPLIYIPTDGVTPPATTGFDWNNMMNMMMFLMMMAIVMSQVRYMTGEREK